MGERVTEPGTASAWRTLAAWCIAAFGPVAAVWSFGGPNQSAMALLAATGLLFAVSLHLAQRDAGTRPLAGVAALASIAIALEWATPRVGKTPGLVLFAGVVVTHAVLGGTRPFPGLPARPRQDCLVALPIAVAAGVVWWRSRSLPLTLGLLALASAVAVLDALAPTSLSALDRPFRRAADGWCAFGRATGLPDAATVVRRVAPGRLRTFLVPRTTRDRWLLTAVVVGFAVRLAWAVTMTQRPQQWYSDWNLQIAHDFARWSTPKFGGLDTAYWPPGHGLTIAPFVWFGARTGWFTAEFAASMVNVAVSTVSIVVVAALATEWFGPQSRNVAAWIMALAPGHVFVNSVAVGEPLALTFWVTITWAVTVVVRRRTDSARLRLLVPVGMLVGYACLTKDITVTMLAAPALVIRSTSGSWHGALRATLAIGAGAAVVLVPWAVRNAVQVGWPSPFATISSEGLCATKYDQDIREYFKNGAGIAALDADLLADCYPGSIFDNRDAATPIPMPEGWEFGTPDEGAWARRNNLGYAKWALTHPWHFVKVTPLRIHGIAGNDTHGGFEMSQQYGTVPTVGPLAAEVAQDGQNAWYYLVLGGTVVGLVVIRRFRRYSPLWFPLAVLGTYTILGPWSQSRHAFPAQAFLAVFAAGTLTFLVAAARRAGEAPDPGAGEAAP